MFRWFLRRQIAGFERTWNYDASYLHELIKVDPQAMLAFGKLQDQQLSQGRAGAACSSRRRE